MTAKKQPGSVVIPTILPFVIIFYSVAGAVAIEWTWLPFLLAVGCAMLVGNAVWLNRNLFGRATTLLPFLVAALAIVAAWLWQRYAFAAWLPSGDLPYGHFLTPEGAAARLWVLVYPFWGAVASLVVCAAAAVALGWRTGARGSLACMIPWWLATFIVFALPSLYLDGQGNASIFI